MTNSSTTTPSLSSPTPTQRSHVIRLALQAFLALFFALLAYILWRYWVITYYDKEIFDHTVVLTAYRIDGFRALIDIIPMVLSGVFCTRTILHLVENRRATHTLDREESPVSQI